MTINDLCGIIIDRGNVYMTTPNFNLKSSIDGCKLLEYIDDIEEFVSLLRDGGKFKCRDPVQNNFVDDHPNPIEIILSGDVVFSALDSKSFFISIGNHYCYHYEEMTTLDTSWWLRGDNLDND